MIKDNFYPDAATQLSTGEKFTAYVPSIPITTEQAPTAYWLGWISKDNLPQAFRHSEISLNNNGYQFSDITPEDNFDCGYNFRMPANHTYYADTPFRMVRYQTGVSKWQANEGNQNSNNFCFGNYINCMCDAISKVEIYVRFTIYDSDDVVVRRSMSNSAALLKSFSFDEFISFLNGGIVTITFGEQGNVDITKQDLETGYFSKETSLGYTVETFVNAYKFIHTRSVNSNNTTDQGSTSKSSCFMAHINTEKYGDTIISGDDTGQGSVMQWDKRYPTQILDKILIWGLHGYFSFNDIDSLSWNGRRHIYNGNVLIFKPDNTYILYVAAIFPFVEIEKHFNLCMRMSKARLTIVDPYAPYYGYIENDVYAPYITEDNEFTATRITGDLEDTEFLDKLRPWQYDITQWEENDYTEEDRPPYEPPSEDETLASGEWLVNGTLPAGSADGFVTMYVLNESQLQNFGADLWAKFFDSGFWESLKVAATETFSLDTSAILQYIVSLKFYPLNIPTLANYVSGVPGTIFVGRGLVGIDVSNSTIGKLSHYSAGYTITSNVIEPYFNDFRDNEPCTRITLYVPFCGVVELTPSQVVGGKVKLEYSFDFSTGACTAAVSITNKENLTYCVCTLNGNIGANVQLSASNLTQAFQRGINMTVNAVKNIGTAVISAGTAMGEASAYGEVGYESGGASPATTEGKIMQAGLQSHANNIASVTGLEALPAPSFGQSSGFSSFLVTTPMIQRTYHYYELPSNYAHIYGYACNKTVTLSELEGKGFTVCKNVELSGIPATQDELSAIESLLTSGVYF